MNKASPQPAINKLEKYKAQLYDSFERVSPGTSAQRDVLRKLEQVYKDIETLKNFVVFDDIKGEPN